MQFQKEAWGLGGFLPFFCILNSGKKELKGFYERTAQPEA